jgi:ABC-type antimicrobial peptide transport system permease subunit
MRVSVVAMVIGLPVSLVGLRVLMSQDFTIAPPVNVWLIGLGVALALLVMASAATWLPARHAARVDPATTLRGE